MDSLKKFSLSQEIAIIVDQIKRGLAEIQLLKYTERYTDENYFAIFQFLSTGFERLLKYAICYSYWQNEEQFPNFKEQNLLHHDITVLLKMFVENYFSTANIPAKIADYKFLTENNEFKQILSVLSNFGKNGRYDNFNIVDNHKCISNVFTTWNSFITHYIESSPDLNNSNDEQYRNTEVAKHFVSLFEQFTRAIFRQFAFGSENPASRDDGYYNHFYMLNDDELGNTDYFKAVYCQCH